jgi:hypothetical protein
MIDQRSQHALELGDALRVVHWPAAERVSLALVAVRGLIMKLSSTAPGTLQGCGRLAFGPKRGGRDIVGPRATPVGA